ncbi:Potassium efflux system KefA protein / Small-conductance mechanosensitive channel [Candidatus Hydrogenisulfobacillus filiaventi]|uniref:Potassium efflux system KefA protein / Small-conductance mechanosensitive channel n=1 Tax=Candidatus Hydrogenisulfobacillus filiaventi TaxID=2707344 RepID=A0A6F8ZLC3_9FIRM|nr:mechanosensitive ion channel family protein [Bacillota bacterium]CAB1130265.1 Potassium efflux system KefA protein / Small-conductance mechanosensitive channel [Candidatus Hydrogenisulfobacillus filiaventi]
MTALRLPLLNPAAERQLAAHLAGVILIVVLAWWGGVVARRALEHVERRRAGENDLSWSRKRTLYRLLVSAVRYVLGFVAVVMALDLFGFHTGSLLAGAGVVGLAVSFGAQGLVQDVVSGLILMYEDPFAVGDHIVLPGGTAGTVEELGLRATILRGGEGERVYLPNRLILQVTNLSRRAPVAREIRLAFPVALPPEKVRILLQEAGAALGEAPEVLGVVDLTGTQQVWGVRLPSAGPEGARAAAAFREAVVRAAAAAGLELAGG